jgi:uncharacterized membrane protein YdjX (TVP38/TMEM64 family)
MSVQATAQRWAPKVRLISILAAIVAFVLIVRTLPIEDLMSSLRAWVEGLGVWGPVVYAGVYVVATILMLPASALTALAGVIFGLGLGTVVVSIGSVTGAACAFLLGRYLLRDKVAQMLTSRPKLRAIDAAIAEGGWKIVAMLRLSPLVPFNVQNYLYGLTPIKFLPCTLTSWIAMLPGTFLYVYIGYTAEQVVGGSGQRSIWEWLTLGAGLLATLLVTIYVSKLVTRKLNEQTQIDEAAEATAKKAASDAVAPAGWPVSAFVAFAIAALLVATAIYLQSNPAALRDLLGLQPLQGTAV